MERYARQIMLDEVGEEGQRLFRQSAVLIVGLGGLGAPVSSYLTGAGIGRIGLCDPDKVSLSNLQRQILYTEGDIDKPKPVAAAERLKSQNSEVEFDLHVEGLTTKNAERIVSYYDCVVDCTDNYPTRQLIERACCVLHKPWVHGSIGAFGGIVTCFDATPTLRYSELFGIDTQPEMPSQPMGVLGAVPGVVGSIQAVETLKIVGRFGEPLFGKILSINLLNNNFDLTTI